MSLFIASLNSGSNGNCYYVGNNNDAVLIDAGISCREIEKRMKRAELKLLKVRAVIISHEHSDHIKGLEYLIKKYRIPVYITHATLKNSRLILDETLVHTFNEEEKIIIGSLTICAFKKLHDAIDPYSFIIEGSGKTIGVFTDIGSVCENLVNHFKLCNAAFLEANYDDKMLAEGNYPYYLKNRIRGGKGHLSNRQALDLFIKHKPAQMTHLLLAHLSKDNNNPELAKELFENHAGQTNVVVASRYEESLVYEIGGTIEEIFEPVFFRNQNAEQLALF